MTVLLKCGHIYEFLDERIEALQEQVAAQYGMKLSDHRMELYGSCIQSDCPHRK